MIDRRSTAFRIVPSGAIALVAATTALLSSCGTGKTRPDPMLSSESFDSDKTFSRSVDATPAQACEAARRALLSQGYVIGKATTESVEGSKNFQPEPENHQQLDIRVSCASHGNDAAWIFLSALQDRYALKKSSSSASVGVGAFGSVSLPVGSSDDSLVRVASSTVQDASFYNRLFARVQQFLPKPVPADVNTDPSPTP